jgi:guanylate kinase
MTFNNQSKISQLIILTGTSGAGKSTLLKLLCERHPELWVSISFTTRAPRPGEIDGREYYFIDRVKFEQMIANEEFLEWTEFADNYYGTPRLPVEQQIQMDQRVLLQLELDGTRKIKSIFPDSLSIFIMPPSLEVIEQRLRNRGHDSLDAIQKRLNLAALEILAAGECDVIIVNDNLQQALNYLETAVFL